MKKKYGKKYYEELALKTLYTFVDETFCELKNLDKPDLQFLNKKIGIEVVRGINEHEGRCQTFLNDYFLGETNLDFLHQKMETMKIGEAEIFVDDRTGVKAFCAYRGLEDMHVKMENLSIRIQKKISLFKTYEQKFNSRGIYIFCGWCFNKDDIFEIVSHLDKPIDIDMIYFDCQNCIHSYNTKDNTIESFLFDMEKYKHILSNIEGQG